MQYHWCCFFDSLVAKDCQYPRDPMQPAIKKKKADCPVDHLNVWFPAHWAPIVLRELHRGEDAYRKTHNLWFDDPHDSDPLRVIEQTLAWAWSATTMEKDSANACNDAPVDSSSRYTTFQRCSSFVNCCRVHRRRRTLFM